MHYLYYVAVKKGENVKTAEGAKDTARERLENENFASDNNGYWGNSKADWYVVGGRWSGHLQAVRMEGLHEKMKAIVNANKKDTTCNFITGGDIKKNDEALQSLWESLGGTGRHYWDRDSYNHDGGDDDSMLLDEKLFTALKKRNDEKKPDNFHDETEVAVISEDGYIEDETTLTNFLAMDDIIGNYYIVVIDYHN